ncbi:MAG: hypothetical protein EOO90_01880 [Pedobacter sp.]|nr:MAG: hypothetical protein EOO90_01880 [Pedobacter sp.]
MEPNTPTQVKNIAFDKSGYYSTILIFLVLLGFWPTFFSKYINGTADFGAYFHFHGAMATAWIGLLIIQPILIRKKKRALHIAVGRLSYVILPLFFASVILLKHHTLGGVVTETLGASLWIQVKDLVIIGVMFTIAIVNRRNMPVHARAMIATGVVFIEPALVRFFINVVFPDNIPAAFGATMLMEYGLMIGL